MTHKEQCELCGDQPDVNEELFLHAACHLTAPLQASIVGDTLTLRCYVPDCKKVVATFKIGVKVSEHVN